MSTGPSSGSKFILYFQVEGSGKEELKKIESQLQNIASEAGGAAKKGILGGEAAKNADQLSKGLKDAADAGLSMKGLGEMMALDKALSAVQGLYEGIIGIGERGVDLFKDIVKESSVFEDIKAGMKFAFGKDSEKVFEEVKKDAANLTFTLEEVSELATSLGRMKINPFGGTEAASQIFKSKTGQNVRALEVLQDTADAVGKKAGDVVVGVRNALAGQWKSLEDRFDIPKDKIKAWKKEIDKLKEPQEKYNKLVSQLGEMFGGAGALKAQNYSKIVAQIPDLLQQLKAGIGEAGLKQLTAGFMDLVTALGGLVKNERAMKSLADVFTVLATGAKYVIQAGAAMITFTTAMLSAHPYLPMMAAGLFVVTGAVAAVTVGIGTLVTALVAAGAVIGMIGLEMMAGLLVPTLMIAVPLLAGLAVGAALIVGAFYSAETSMGGFVGILLSAKTLIQGVKEAYENWNDETTVVSGETYEAMKQQGVLGYFEELVSWMRRAQVFFAGFKAGFLAEWGTSAEKMGTAFDGVLLAFERILASFGLLNASSDTTLDGATSKGQTFGQRVAAALGQVADVVVRINNGVASVLRDLPAVLETAAKWKLTMTEIKNSLEIVGDVIYGTIAVAFSFVGTIVMDLVKAIQASSLALEAVGEAMRGNFDAAGEKGLKAAEIMKSIEDPFANAGKEVDKMAGSIAGDYVDLIKANENYADSMEYADTMRQKMYEYDNRAPAYVEPKAEPISSFDPNWRPRDRRSESYYNADDEAQRGMYSSGSDPSAVGGVSQPQANVSMNIHPQVVELHMDGEKMGEANAKYLIENQERLGLNFSQ